MITSKWSVWEQVTPPASAVNLSYFIVSWHLVQCAVPALLLGSVWKQPPLGRWWGTTFLGRMLSLQKPNSAFPGHPEVPSPQFTITGIIQLVILLLLSEPGTPQRSPGFWSCIQTCFIFPKPTVKSVIFAKDLCCVLVFENRKKSREDFLT